MPPFCILVAFHACYHGKQKEGGDGMAANQAPRKVSDLAARTEVLDAMDSYGLSDPKELARHLDLSVDQVQRVLLDLETDDQLDDLDD